MMPDCITAQKRSPDKGKYKTKKTNNHEFSCYFHRSVHPLYFPALFRSPCQIPSVIIRQWEPRGFVISV